MPSPRIRRLKKAASLAAWKKATGQEEAAPTEVVEESVAEAETAVEAAPVVETKLAMEAAPVVKTAPTKSKKKRAKKPAKKKSAPKKVEVTNED